LEAAALAAEVAQAVKLLVLLVEIRLLALRY